MSSGGTAPAWRDAALAIASALIVGSCSPASTGSLPDQTVPGHGVQVAAPPPSGPPTRLPPIEAVVRAWNVAEAQAVWMASSVVDLSRAPPHAIVEGALRFDCSREAVRVVPLEEDAWLMPHEFPVGRADWLRSEWTARDSRNRPLPAGWSFVSGRWLARGPDGGTWEFPHAYLSALEGWTLAYAPYPGRESQPRICVMTIPRSVDDWCVPLSEALPERRRLDGIDDLACDGSRVLLLSLPWMALLDAKSGRVLWRRDLTSEVPPLRAQTERRQNWRWYAAQCSLVGDSCFVHAHTYAFALHAADGSLDYWMDFGDAPPVPSLLRGSGPLFLFTPREFTVNRDGLSWQETAQPR